MRTMLSCVFMWAVCCGTLATAAEVVVSGVHLCCQSCVDGVNEAFTGVAAVSQVVVDKEAKTVTFTVADKEGLKAGLQALAKAGYAGGVKYDGTEVPFPGSKRPDATVDEVTLRGLHNCCGGCAKAIEGALKGVTGVTSVSIDDRVVTVKGSKVSQKALLDSLHAVGLHGNIPQPKAVDTVK